MENAYALAMEIADNFCKSTIRNNWKHHHITDTSIDTILEEPWLNIVKRGVCDEGLLKIHQQVFQSAYVILGRSKTSEDKQVHFQKKIMDESNDQLKQQTTPSTCTVPLHPAGCQCEDNRAHAKKVELYWENCGE